VAPRPGLQVKRTYHDRQKQFLREEYTYYADRNGLEVRHGLYTRLYENGRFHERGTYVDGRMEGLWTRWTYRDLSTNVYSPVKEISAVYEIPYKGGLRVGLGKARETCNGGLPYREYTYNDLTMKEEGPCVQYGIDNGQAYMEGKGAYKDGRMDGVWVHYYPTGKPRKQESYAAGVRHGVWKTYRPTGLPQEVKEYSNGRLDGQYVNYYANGKAWTTGTYNKDERNGKWVKYSEDGRLVAEEYYDSGRSVGTWKIYRPDGRVLSTTEKRGQRERDPNREVVRY
jgi:antitoxin component YwqK of YwqJK toxin-antitoxin module